MASDQTEKDDNLSTEYAKKHSRWLPIGNQVETVGLDMDRFTERKGMNLTTSINRIHLLPQL